MKKILFIAASITVIVAAVVSVLLMMNKDGKASGFKVADGKLAISGSFAVTVPLSEISDVSLTDTKPAISLKTNGARLGNQCKGAFTLENGQEAHIYADIGAPPFITFRHKDAVFYINAETPAATQALYDQIKSNMA